MNGPSLSLCLLTYINFSLVNQFLSVVSLSIIRIDSKSAKNELKRASGLNYYNGWKPIRQTIEGYGTAHGINGAIGSFDGTNCGSINRASYFDGSGGVFGSSAVTTSAIEEPVVGAGKAMVRKTAQVLPERIEEGDTVVLQQESAPLRVSNDASASAVRISHVAKPAIIEYFETPFIIDLFQKSIVINHVSEPTMVDHYEMPDVITDDGSPVIYKPAPPVCGAGCHHDVMTH